MTGDANREDDRSGRSRASDAGPVRASGPDRARDRRASRRRPAVPFLLASVIPAGALVWWFTKPEEARQAVLDRIPKGVGSRAVTAGIALALLIVLARVVLPGTKATGEAIGRARKWIRNRGRGARLALSPVALVVELLWLTMKSLFVLDALAIVGCAVAFLVYVARIVKPDLLPGLPG